MSLYFDEKKTFCSINKFCGFDGKVSFRSFMVKVYLYSFGGIKQFFVLLRKYVLYSFLGNSFSYTTRDRGSGLEFLNWDIFNIQRIPFFSCSTRLLNPNTASLLIKIEQFVNLLFNCPIATI